MRECVSLPLWHHLNDLYSFKKPVELEHNRGRRDKLRRNRRGNSRGVWLSKQEAKGQDCIYVVVNLSPTCTGCKVAVSSVCATAHTLSLDPHFQYVEGDIRKLQRSGRWSQRKADFRRLVLQMAWLQVRQRGVVPFCMQVGPHNSLTPPQSVTAFLRPAQFHHHLTHKYMKKSKSWVYLLKQVPAYCLKLWLHFHNIIQQHHNL